MSKLVAVSIGDIKGIGIELLIREWQKNKIRDFVLFTNIEFLRNYIRKKKLKIKLNLINNNEYNSNKGYLNIYNYNSSSDEENTFLSIKNAFLECKKNNFIGLITLPLRKDLIKKKIYKNFIGHTELLQNFDKKYFTNMILYHKKIIVSPLTTHIPLSLVSKIIKKKNYLKDRILGIYKSLKRDFNIKNPKLVISGMNPHAGEKGYIGNEEKLIISPVLKKLNANGVNITGPLPADSLLTNFNLKNFDCFIFITHDQALIPYKYISNYSGINYTGNLDIIRTSPDHGTAYNLVGNNKASSLSLINCFKLIKKISKNRKNNDCSEKISWSKFSKR